MSKPVSYPFDEDYQKILARYGKSFNWALFFLKKQDKKNIRVLYAFLRYLDDMVDETEDKDFAYQQVQKVQKALDEKDKINRLLQKVIDLADRRVISYRVLSQFIKGITWDLHHSIIHTESELIRYCYGVASTVGLSMCHLLQVKNKQALRYAVDLGVAMQLTNIARDVIEDAENDRVYLPQSWFVHAITPHDICHNHLRREEVFRVVIKLLALADEYYASANNGIAYLPINAKASVLVATKIYKKIGDKITTLSANQYWQVGRVYTRTVEKFFVTVTALSQLLYKKNVYCISSIPRHKAQLHQHLKGLMREENITV